MNTFIIFLLISLFSLGEGVFPYFSFQLHYCKFQCVDPCEGTNEADNPNGNAKNPTAYYWRDFYGPIPTDAFPIGNPLQNPQTFIGLVFDPSKKGAFVTTIVEGLDYVYSVLNGNVTKISKNIQILCTNEPERMVWMKVTRQNYLTLENLSFVAGSVHKANNDIFKHYITRTSNCQVLYAGFPMGETMEYVLLDGKNSTTENFMHLLYRNKEIENDEKKIKNKPFLSHLYEYSIRPNSIIPSFYKQINIGSCSMICTNEGKGREGKLKSNKRSLASMAYYWKPSFVFNEEEGFEAAPKLYIGQAYSTSLNWYDVGLVNSNSFYMNGDNKIFSQYDNFQVFSTNHPDKFTWINTTSDEFIQMENKTMIPGGELANGTKVVVGRRAYSSMGYFPGSIRNFSTSASIYISIYIFTKGPYNDFEFLQFSDS